MFISDKCLGLLEALGKFYPEAKHQRCIVHFYRNVFSVVPNSKVKEVAAMLKVIHAQEDRDQALLKAKAVEGRLMDMRLAKAAQNVPADQRAKHQGFLCGALGSKPGHRTITKEQKTTRSRTV